MSKAGREADGRSHPAGAIRRLWDRLKSIFPTTGAAGSTQTQHEPGPVHARPRTDPHSLKEALQEAEETQRPKATGP
jgi:hypothetical protein